MGAPSRVDVCRRGGLVYVAAREARVGRDSGAADRRGLDDGAGRRRGYVADHDDPGARTTVGRLAMARVAPRSFGIALGLVTAGQFLLPAHHATWSGALPIPNVYTAIEGFQHLPIDLHPRFHLNASLASEQAGDLTRAAWSCDAALRLDDRFAAAYGQRASLRLRESRIAEAEADVGAALHLDPGQADALFVRADIGASRGETHSAVLELRRALASAPDEWSRRNVAQQLLAKLLIGHSAADP